MGDQKRLNAEPPRIDYPSDEEICARVYEMFFIERRRLPPGDYWRLAEDDLLDRAAKKILRR